MISSALRFEARIRVSIRCCCNDRNKLCLVSNSVTLAIDFILFSVIVAHSFSLSNLSVPSPDNFETMKMKE